MDDIWEVEPKITNRTTLHRMFIKAQLEKRTISATVQIDEFGGLEVLYYHHFFDHQPKDSYERFKQRQEVYEWLIEWELACWRSIGPEDSEVFATKKLDPEWGLE